MQYTDTGLYEKKASLLGMGSMRLPKREDGSIDIPQSEKMVALAMERGVNYYDTAWCYHGGKSESVMGDLLANYPRESFFLADKMPVWLCKNEADVRRIFDEQLKKCRVDYFDNYLAHSIDNEDYPDMVKSDTYRILREKKEQGLIRRLGFSFHGDKALWKTMTEEYDWDFAQIEMNYLDWKEQDAEYLYTWLAEHRLPMIIMEPARGGYLANPPAAVRGMLEEACPGISPAELAYRWFFGRPGIFTILSGASSLRQMEENLAVFDAGEPLSEAQTEALARAAEYLMRMERVACTGCGYCMPCPAGVDIPGMLKLLNRFLETKTTWEAKNAYLKFPEEQRACACISCGACTSHCPQGIKAFVHMEEISDTIGKF